MTEGLSVSFATLEMHIRCLTECLNETDQIFLKATFDYGFYLHLQIDLQVVPHFEFSVKNPHDVWDGKNMDYVR